MVSVVYNEVESNEWVEEYEWIGIIYPHDVRPNVMLITPLALSSDNRLWQRIADNICHQYFPNNGKIAYFPKDSSASKANQLYRFKPSYSTWITPETSDYTDPKRSRYTANKPEPAPLAQLFDWSARGKNIFELPELLEQGIAAEDCLVPKIYIRYQNYLYGPINLEPDRIDPQYLKPQAYQPNRDGRLLLYEHSMDETPVVMLENRQFVDPQTLNVPREEIDWSLPKTVIKRALRACKYNLTNRKEPTRLVDRYINELADLISAGGPQALQIESSTIQRAQYIVQHQLERLDDLQALIEELPEQHPLLVKARAWEVSQREEVIKQEIARQCETEQARLHHLQAKVNTTQQQLDTLTEAVEQAQQIQEQMNAEFKTLENHMQKRLTELRQEPLHLLADLQLATTLPITLFQSHISEPRDQVNPIIAVREQDSFFTDSAPTINDPRDSLWTKIAKQNETTINSVRACAAALLTGFIPAVYEPAAWSILQAVAQTIAGLRIWSIPVPLTALAPLDLFGKMNIDQQAFFPTSDLADILIEAQEHPEQLGLVVLEGIDRVPFQPVIAPLLRHYRLVRQHMQRNEQALCKETLPLFPVRTLSANDPYQRISRLNWPPNLLLAATFDHDASSFSFPAYYASWFATIEKRNATSSTGEDERIVREISSTTWYTWERDISLQDLSFPLELEQWQQDFYQALHFLGMKNEYIKIIEQIWPQS